MSYVRNSLLSVRDGHLNLNDFMQYSGILNGLGLMDVLDNQYEHYCLNGKEAIVNIDPDFFAFTKSQKHVANYDWRMFKKTLRDEEVIHKIGTDLKSRRRNMIRKIKRRMKDKTLVDYLHDIENSHVLKENSTENIFE